LAKAKMGLEKDAAAITYMGTNLFHNRQAEAMAFDNSNTLVEVIKTENTLQAINKAGVPNTLSRLLSSTQKKPGITADSIDASVSLPLMQYYSLTNTNPAEARSYIAKKKSIDASNAALAAEKMQLSKLLYTLYIKPFESIIKGKKTLYISADNVQHYFPFETLMMDDGRYLAEAYDIIYTPSFTIHEYLQKRSYNSGSSIIAAGNPDYSTYHPELHEGRALDLSYYGISSWTDLPGTEQEIKVLQQQFDSITVYTGNALSETNLKQLSEAGRLSTASALHFALHGLGTKTGANEDNAIVITEPDKGKEDGLLLFYEAYNLDIKPQIVCLSACETGLGMMAQDGSWVTMGTAFLAAGAKAVLVTNWSIDDGATAIFMKDVYQQVRTTGTGYAAAVANTKRKFIKGDFGEAYKNPFYWAPFKYYGN
jgi:CHAT domain-containing protein